MHVQLNSSGVSVSIECATAQELQAVLTLVLDASREQHVLAERELQAESTRRLSEENRKMGFFIRMLGYFVSACEQAKQKP